MGVWPESYMHNPNVDKPIEQIWDDIDAYSFEERYEDDKNLHNGILFVSPIPPLNYKGKFLKGFCYSQGTRILLDKYPDLKKLYVVCANSMFSSYPWSAKADVYFTCYKNEAREKYYKNKYPDRKNIVCLPLQDADWLNEYTIAPIPNTVKTIDVFAVSTPFPVKNLPVIAKALLVYEQKYGKVLKMTYAIGQRCTHKREDGSLDYSQLGDYGKNVLIEVDKILGDTKKYINFEPYIDYKDLSKYYSSSRCAVLGSLIEGKNRFISEAMSCDTPIVVFKDFNKYSRGDYPVFFGNSGEYVPEFTPESLADTIHKVITSPQNYEPRKNYLIHNGRKNFVNTVVDSIPYYRENLPDWQEGRIMDNVWLDMACWDNYHMSYHNYIYGNSYATSYVAGLEKIDTLLQTLSTKFGISWYNKQD